MVKEKYVDVKNNYKQDMYGRDTTQKHLYQHNITIVNNNTSSDQYRAISLIVLSDSDIEINTIEKIYHITGESYLSCSGGDTSVDEKAFRVYITSTNYNVESIYDLEEIYTGSDSDSVVDDNIFKIF